MVIVGLFLFVLMGCQTQEKQTEAPHQDSSHGDVQETTNNANTLPSFVKKLDPQIGQIYQVAAQNHQLLQWIPCYCGCGESAGHRSNLDCFVKEVKQNGQITWDSHGTQCGTCLEIAAESVALQKQGKSTKEIRNYIDEKYKEGYAKPTPTPMPL
jgi:hypothetical protein